MNVDIFSPENYKIGGIIKAADTVEDVIKKKKAETSKLLKASLKNKKLQKMPLSTEESRDIFEKSREIKKMDSIPKGFLKDGTPTELTRQERAKALGFRVDEPVYHGTRQDLRRFDNEMIGTETDEGFFGRGHYFASTPGEASTYGPNVEEYFTRGKLLDLTPTTYGETNQFKDLANKLNKIGALDEQSQINLASLDKIDDYVKNNVIILKAKNYDGTEGFIARVPHPAIQGEIYDSPIQGFAERPFPLKKEDAIEDLKESLIFNAQHTPMMSQGISSVFPLKKPNKFLNPIFDLEDFVRHSGYGPAGFTNKAIEAGYDGIKVGDETVIFDPKNIRRSDAEFDPKKTELDDLLSYTPEDKKGIGSLA